MDKYEQLMNYKKQADEIYSYIETKISDHMSLNTTVLEGCKEFGYDQFLPQAYLDGYVKAIKNINHMLTKFKIGG